MAAFPELPYAPWVDTKIKRHLIAQIVGKVRLRLAPPVNHWWHAPLYVSARGLTTSATPYGAGAFDVELDLHEHAAVIRTSAGDTRRVPFATGSIADFYAAFVAVLDGLGIDAAIHPRPFDPARTGSDIAFADDTTHVAYDPDRALRFWRALVGINAILYEFRGRFLGKCSPVHVFWHSLDIAVTRFSGRVAPVAPEADPVTEVAYSHENISAGFWGGDANFQEAAFYSYTHPEPEGLASEPLKPGSAWWQPQNGTHMALLRYEDFRTSGDPRAVLLDFLQSTYEAGAKRAEWPRDALELPQR